MLKKITLNGKRVPVPVPIKTLAEALQWVERHLLRPDHTITRIELNGQDVELDTQGQIKRPATPMLEDTELRLQMDSPTDICVQTIDALRNLGTGVGRNLKPVAVHLWEYKGHKIPAEADMVLEDIQLLVELYEHVMVLMDKRIDVSNALQLQRQIIKAHSALNLAAQSQDWKGVAKVLLNQLETPILELANELSSLQRAVFEVEADKNFERKRLQK